MVGPDGAPSLPRCLASLRGIAETTVVVEAQSGDDMATVRNDALDRASGGWVLMLDATHTLDPESVDLVRNLVKRDQFVAYTARELHQFGLDGAVSSIEQRTAALFPLHPDLRYGNLYRWLLGDEMFVRYQGGFPLPSSRFTAYRESADAA